jgi:hypothetical protein
LLEVGTAEAAVAVAVVTVAWLALALLRPRWLKTRMKTPPTCSSPCKLL